MVTTEESILDQIAALPPHMPMGAAAVAVAEAMGLSTDGVADAARRAAWAGHGWRCAIFQAVAPDELGTARCICPGAILAETSG